MRHVLVALIAVTIASAASAQSVPADRERIPLWAGGAPGSVARRGEAELAQDYWVRNVHDPSLTVFLPPPSKANGAAVIVVPGGGHRLLVYKAEGEEPAAFLASLGVTAFALTYRLAREEGSTYTVDRDARADATRAIRLVRSKAADWGLDPKRVGIMGFSAGGEIVGLVTFGSGDGDARAADPVDRLNGRPDFSIFVYPGPVALPKAVPAGAPPAFVVAAMDDPCCVSPALGLLQMYRMANASMEGHVYATGGHGFNMGQRSTLKSVSTWPQRLAEWLADHGWLGK